MSGSRRFSRDRQGRYHPHLSTEEKELLGSLPAQALQLLAAHDPSTRRLFPVAYPDDPTAELEYQVLVGDTVIERHRQALDTLADGAAADALDEGELELWMDAFEVLRLVLGTQLDVQEDMGEIDPDDPRAPGLALYAYLSMLQEEVVSALAAGLPERGTEG